MEMLLKPAHYHEENFFVIEKENIFRSSWIYVGLLDDLSQNQDYLCASVAGKSIVIMNFNGHLKAFHNICSHRFSRILKEEKGNGPLQCQYHGWTYNDEGVPYAIPSRKCFKSICDTQDLKLNQYAVDKCGRFVFVNLAPAQETVCDYLGDAAATLLRFSESLGKEIDCNKMMIQANWKVVVENTLEDYHVRVVHPDSLYKLGIDDRSFNHQGLHSSTNLKFKIKLENNKYVASAYNNRAMKITDYDHQLIFPNLTIASAYGTTISIQQIIPIAVRKTCFISRVYGIKTIQDESSKNKAVHAAFNQSAIEFNRTVFEEDKTVCEQTQLGLEEATKETGVLHDSEIRVFNFQKNYLELLQKGTF